MFTSLVRRKAKAARRTVVQKAPKQRRIVAPKVDPAVQRCSCGRVHREQLSADHDPALEANDPLEREADRVADQVLDAREPGAPPKITSRPTPGLDRKCEACEKEEEESAGLLQRKPAAAPAHRTSSSDFDPVAAVGSGGRPLNGEELAFFEPRFGRDLSELRLHTGSAAGSAASELGARAFTYGHHVAFGEGEYSSSTREGRWLMAHEITHFVQQSSPAMLHSRDRSAPRDPRRILARLGAGRPLESGVRTRMEAAFGSSFADVRVHRDERAARLCSEFNASAFAVGNHVSFVPHLYRPGTVVGDALLAHELAHVEQQKGQKPQAPSATVAVNQPELEADANSTTRSVLIRLWQNKVSRPFQRALPRLLDPAVPKLTSPVRLSLNSCGSSSTEQTPAAADPCDDICRRANADASLNHGGGGVVCDGASKCPCVFDLPWIRAGQCPDYDRIAITHERRHMSEVNCDSSRGLHRPPFSDPSAATTSECTHRRETIRLLNEALPRQSASCQTGMTGTRDVLQTWVGANC